MADIKNMTYDTAIDLLKLKTLSTALNNRKHFILGYLTALCEEHFIRMEDFDLPVLAQIEYVRMKLMNEVKDIEEHSDPYDEDECHFKTDLYFAIDRLENFTVRITNAILASY